MVFVFIAGVWVSGILQSESDDLCVVRLVTGQEVVRNSTEVRRESPRLLDESAWPV